MGWGGVGGGEGVGEVVGCGAGGGEGGWGERGWGEGPSRDDATSTGSCGGKGAGHDCHMHCISHIPIR